MRILQVHTAYRQAGGEDAVVAAHRELLTSRGHHVEALVAENPRSPAEAIGGLAVAPWNPRWFLRARRAIERLAPDVVHLHNTWFAMSPSVAEALEDVPSVMTVHNYRLACANGMLFRQGAPCELCVGTHPWHAVKFGCYRGRLASVPAALTITVSRRRRTWERGIDLLLPLTDFGRGRLEAAGIPVDRMEVVSNFTPDPGPRDTPPSVSDRVLLVGRLSPEKGIMEFLHEWHRIPPPGLKLSILGEGPLRGEIDRSRPHGVEILGRLPAREVVQMMLGSRALVFPSLWYEGQPLVVLEALAAGLPVLASGLGGVGEMVAPLGPGWSVSDGGGWGQGFEMLSDDRAVDGASVRARARYEAAHAPGIVGDALERVYAKAIGTRRG